MRSIASMPIRDCQSASSSTWPGKRQRGRAKNPRLAGRRRSVRVVHVVRQFNPGIGGLENFVFSLAKQQRMEGVNAEVVTLDRLFSKPSTRLLRHDSVEGVPVHRIGFLGSSRYPIAPEVLSCIEPFDIVHVHGVDYFCDFLAATRPLHRKPWSSPPTVASFTQNLQAF